jgi:DNA-binding NtrC family response regulator
MIQAMSRNVLLVTADADTASLVLETLSERRLSGTHCKDLTSALGMIAQRNWGLALLDLDLPGSEATKVIGLVKHQLPESPVIALSGQAAVSLVVRAIRKGCEDFLVKPLSRQAVEQVLDASLPNSKQQEEEISPVSTMAGRSPKLLEVVSLARRVAPTSAAVLITGESGIGKELLSHFIHCHSQRASGPYIRVNCASLSESLLESELFGHERGAFTGAHAQRKGRFERAHGGTLLLDEISETSNRLQAELLRVLESQEIERVGGHESVPLNVRIICTSNRQLAQEAKEGRFRADLFFRISGVHLRMPPLRERREDLPALIWHFVSLHAPEVGRQITALDPKMMTRLVNHQWPGNIRELRNVVRTALIMGEGTTLSLHSSQVLEAGEFHCSGAAPAVFAGVSRAAANAAAMAPPCAEDASDDVLSLQEIERQAILEALRRTSRNQAKAALLLGITDRTLREKLRRYRQDGCYEPDAAPLAPAARAVGT